MKKIEGIKLISQRDQVHASKKLGNSSLTIGSDGCVLVSATMLVNKVLNLNETPVSLNQKMVDNGGYSGALWVWSALSKVFPQIIFDGRRDPIGVPADIVEIRGYIDRDIPVIIMVDFDRGKDGVQQHFVLVIGYTDNDLVVADPWYGDEVYLRARYGNQDPKVTVLGVRLYGTVAPLPVGTDWIAGVKAAFEAEGYVYPLAYPETVKILLEDHKRVFDLDKIISELRGQVSSLQVENRGLLGKVDDCNQDWQKKEAAWLSEKQTLTVNNSALMTANLELSTKNTALQKEVNTLGDQLKFAREEKGNWTAWDVVLALGRDLINGLKKYRIEK